NGFEQVNDREVGAFGHPARAVEGESRGMGECGSGMLHDLGALHARACDVGESHRRARPSGDERGGVLDAELARCADSRQALLSIVAPGAHRPPAMAGTMLSSSPLLTFVSSPSRKRMSSSPRYRFTKRRTPFS